MRLSTLKESYPDTRGGPQKVLTIVVNWERIRPDRYESGEVADRPPVPKIRLGWSELHPALKELPAGGYDPALGRVKY